MALVPPVRREPYRPPPREPLPESEMGEKGAVTASRGDDISTTTDAAVTEQPVPEGPVATRPTDTGQVLQSTTPEGDTAAPAPEEFGAGLEDRPPGPAE
jgi:hypothetical protein